MADPAVRLLELLSLLQTRRDWPGADLADRLGVSARTVRRDVDRLRELGYPVAAAKGPDGGYRLAAGADLPPLLFDDQQAVALVVALQNAAIGGAGMAEAALRALTTIRQVLPAHLRARVAALEVTAVEPVGRALAPVEPPTLLAISDAVRSQEVLRFDYHAPSPTGAATAAVERRRVEPHHVATWTGRWYLVAWDLDRRAWRTFRIDRLRPVANTGPRFEPRQLPGGDVGTFLARRFQGVDRTGGWPCIGEVIVDRPAAEVAPYARGAQVTELGGDRCRLRIGSWSWVALAADLGRFDAAVEVLDPPELRRACATLANRYAAAASSEP